MGRKNLTSWVGKDHVWGAYRAKKSCITLLLVLCGAVRV